jgi:hypothetical protein
VLAFLESSQLGLPNPSLQARVHPPFGSGGRGTLAGERGGGRVPIPTQGTYTVVLYIHMYFVPNPIAVSVAGIPRCSCEAEDAAGPPLLAPQRGRDDGRPQGLRLDCPGLPERIHTQGIFGFSPERWRIEVKVPTAINFALFCMRNFVLFR